MRSPEHSSKRADYRERLNVAYVKDQEHKVHTVKQDKEYACWTQTRALESAQKQSAGKARWVILLNISGHTGLFFCWVQHQKFALDCAPQLHAHNVTWTCSKSSKCPTRSVKRQCTKAEQKWCSFAMKWSAQVNHICPSFVRRCQCLVTNKRRCLNTFWLLGSLPISFTCMLKCKAQQIWAQSTR